jgi:predicted DNA-binding transcriptional regulator YafY
MMFPMLATSARLLRLLTLFQSQREWPGGDLAARLAVDVRTVRRDVDRLRSLGYNVEASAGIGGGYRMGRGSSMPPLLLADDETVAVALGLLTSALGAISGIEEVSLRAFAKLGQIVPRRLHHRIEALRRSTVALTPVGEATVDAELLAAVAVACQDDERLQLRYRAHDGVETDRVVEPHRLVCVARRWYLLAWDMEKADWRTFRLDRVLGQRGAGSRFVRRPMPRQAQALVADAVTSGPYRYKARVRMHASAVELADQMPADAGRIEPHGPRSCTLHVGASSVERLAAHLCTLGIDFEVIEPPELVAAVRALGQRCARATKRRRQGRKQSDSNALKQ